MQWTWRFWGKYEPNELKYIPFSCTGYSADYINKNQLKYPSVSSKVAGKYRKSMGHVTGWKTFENGPGTSHIPNIDSSSCDLILGRSAPDFHIFCYGSKDEANVGWCLICWTSAGSHETLLVKTSSGAVSNWYQLVPGVMRIIMAMRVWGLGTMWNLGALSCAFHSAMVRIY